MKTCTPLEVGAFEAKNRLSALLDLAAGGQQIWITKHGKRIALLSSGMESGAPAAMDIVETFRSIRAKCKPGPESLKTLIEEGRK
jgi:prevent-host-death family protein